MGTETGAATPLSRVERLGYALGDSASNFYWKVFEFFLLYFYTDVFGLSPAQAATLLLVTRVWDAVSDPMMGALADRTRTRFGRFRPWLLWIAAPIGACGVALFSVPPLGPHEKLVYAYVTYILMMTLYTAINIPYSALMAVMTRDARERAQLSSLRFVGAFAAALLVQSFTPRLVAALGDGSTTLGFQRTMALYGFVATALFIVCFATTRERVDPGPPQAASLREDVSGLLQNGAWRVLFGLGLLVVCGFAARGSTLLYYFKYYLRSPERFELFMLASGFAALLGALLMPWASARIGRRRLYIACMASSGALTALFYFLPATEYAAIFALNTLISFLLGPTAPLLFAMFADAADYGQWRTGKGAIGLVMAAAILALKLGGAVGGYLGGMVLELSGFVANETQSPAALRGILLLVGAIPAGTCLLAALLARAYPLDDASLARMSLELGQRSELTEGGRPG